MKDAHKFKPVAGYPSKRAAVRDMALKGYSMNAIIDAVQSSRGTVQKEISRLRKRDREFAENFEGFRTSNPSGPCGYTPEQVLSAILDARNTSLPKAIRIEAKYMVGIAKDPAAVGIFPCNSVAYPTETTYNCAADGVLPAPTASLTKSDNVRSPDNA